MFDSLMELTNQSAINFAHNLSDWNHKIFFALLTLDFLLIICAAYFKPEQIEKLPITIFGLLFTSCVGLCLFAWLPEIWKMGWDTVQYIASKAASGTIEANPTKLLNQAFSIVKHLFSSAASNGGWNPFQQFGNTIISIVIAYGVFFLFVIIIFEVVGNYIMWAVLGALGGIFVVMYVFRATRPSFVNYTKYMLGLLFKTFGLFLMVSMLSIYLNTFSDFDKNLGAPPKTPSCQIVKNVQDKIQTCKTTDCKSNLYQGLTDARKSCSKEKMKLDAWNIKASHGFVERGLILLLVLFIFVMLVKTIPTVLASFVGIGDFSLKGMSQAMGAVAMGVGAAKMLANSNPGQAVAAGAKRVGEAVGAGIGQVAGGVAGGMANNEMGGIHGPVGRVAGKGLQKAGSISTSAAAAGLDATRTVVEFVGGSKDPVKQKQHAQDLTKRTLDQLNPKR
jgi:hypothetical protein